MHESCICRGGYPRTAIRGPNWRMGVWRIFIGGTDHGGPITAYSGMADESWRKGASRMALLFDSPLSLLRFEKSSANHAGSSTPGECPPALIGSAWVKPARFESATVVSARHGLHDAAVNTALAVAPPQD
jgi:hypothetical protein